MFSWSCLSDNNSFFKTYVKCHCLALFPWPLTLYKITALALLQAPFQYAQRFLPCLKMMTEFLKADTCAQHLLSNTHRVSISRSHHNQSTWSSAQRSRLHQCSILPCLDCLLSRLRDTCFKGALRGRLCWSWSQVSTFKCYKLKYILGCFNVYKAAYHLHYWGTVDASPCYSPTWNPCVPASSLIKWAWLCQKDQRRGSDHSNCISWTSFLNSGFGYI